MFLQSFYIVVKYDFQETELKLIYTALDISIKVLKCM